MKRFPGSPLSRGQPENGCFSGDNSERVPPDPIPNSEVKTLRADDSVSFSCESRTSPDLYTKPQLAKLAGVFYYQNPLNKTKTEPRA